MIPKQARVHVELDVEAAVAGALDELDRAARLLDPVARHEVRDLQPRLGVLGGADRLLDRLELALVAAARVRRVELPVERSGRAR